MSVELKVKIKDDERTFQKIFLIYDDITLNFEDENIKKCLNEAIEEFQGEPDDVQILALLVAK